MELSKPLKSVFPAWWPGSVTALQNWSITPSHSCLECHLPGKPQQSVSEHCPSLALCLNHLLRKSILEKDNSCYWPADVSFPQTLEGDWESSMTAHARHAFFSWPPIKWTLTYSTTQILAIYVFFFCVLACVLLHLWVCLCVEARGQPEYCFFSGTICFMFCWDRISHWTQSLPTRVGW